MTATVRVLNTGGTIASTGGDGGATPEKRGDELLAAVPGLADYADLEAVQVAQIPSFDMDFPTIRRIADSIQEAATDGVDGVVVTHGTDTMEESAYVLDLLLNEPIPVVLTGAQRRPDETSPDGPANLQTSVRAASHGRLAGTGGVYIAFDEELHPARNVTKSHTSSLDTFESPDAGPVAVFGRGEPRFFREPGTITPHLPVDELSAVVEMVKTGIGVGGVDIERAIEVQADGLVVEGTGLGNTTTAIGDAIAEAIEAGIDVVVTSRCHGGAVEPVYGGGGGGATLAAHGVHFGGALPAHKARLKLLLVLSAGATPSDYFE